MIPMHVKLLIAVGGISVAAVAYFFRSYFSTRDVQAEMARGLVMSERWAAIGRPGAETALLHEFADGSCQVQQDEDTFSFESYSRAEARLHEDGYRRVSGLARDSSLRRPDDSEPLPTKLEWWADVGTSYVYLARVQLFDDGTCHVLDIDGNTHEFDSYATTETWLRKDEYALVQALIREGQLPANFPLPVATHPTEILRQMRHEGPQAQAIIADSPNSRT